MKFDISKTRDGIFYDFDVELALLPSLLESKDAVFKTPCRIKGRYVTEKGEVYFDSEARVTVIFRCDRCLEDTEVEIVFPVNETFVTAESRKAYEDDVFRYESNVVDITDAVEQAFMLELPIKVVCREDCKGLCPVCGVNLNETTCDCDKGERVSEQTDDPDDDNPFAVLKNINFNGRCD